MHTTLENVSTCQNKAPYKINSPVTRWFMALVALVTILRLIIASAVPLGGDEAYYWLWSKHLSLGYYDHPPLISLLIYLFGLAGGDAIVFVRMASVLLASLAAWTTFILAERVTGSLRTAFIAGLLTMACPIFAAKALEISPDSPLVAFSMLYVFTAYMAIFENRRIYWLWMGVWFGLAILTKLTAFLLPVSLAAFLITSPGHRGFLKRPEPYLSLLVSGLIFSPFLAWCALNNWVTFRFHMITRVSQEAYAWKNYLPKFLGEQAAAYSPFLFILALAAIVKVFLTQANGRSVDKSRYMFLAMFGLVPIGIFGLISIRCQIFPHWTMAAYPPLFILCAALYGMWRECGAGWKAGFFNFAAGFAVFMTVLFYVALSSPGLQSCFIKPGEHNEIFAYTKLAGLIKQSADARMFVLTDSYARSSSLSYYTGRQAYLITRTQIMGKEFLRWQDMNGLIGRDAIYVDAFPLSERQDIAEILKTSFRTVEPEQVWPIYSSNSLFKREGFLVKNFYVTVCRDFRKNNFYDERDIRLLNALQPLNKTGIRRPTENAKDAESFTNRIKHARLSMKSIRNISGR